jgi:hypothetical protein
MKVHEYNEMMAYLLRPRQKFAIGGGVVEGEDLGSREGYAAPAGYEPKIEKITGARNPDFINKFGFRTLYTVPEDTPGFLGKAGERSVFNTKADAKRFIKEDLPEIISPVRADKTKIAQVKKLFEEGKTNQQVADELKSNTNTIKRIKKDLGLDVVKKKQLETLKQKYIKVKNLAEKANKGFKYTQMKDLLEEAGLSTSRSSSQEAALKKYNVPKLESATDKVRKAFKFLISNPNKPVEELFSFNSKIAELTGTNQNQVSMILSKDPEYIDFKPIMNKLIIPSSRARLTGKNMVLADLIEEVENVKPTGSGGVPRGARSTPEYFIFDNAIKHVKQGGTKVEFTKMPGTLDETGKLISTTDAEFIYKGKKYTYDDLLKTGRKNFPEVYKTFDDLDELLNRDVVHPVTKQKINFSTLMKEAYNKGAGYSLERSPYAIDHFKQVKEEPFTDLRITSARLNSSAGVLKQKEFQAKQGAFGPEKTKLYAPEKVERNLKKMGYDFTKDPNKLFDDEIKLAKDILVRKRILKTPIQIAQDYEKLELENLKKIPGVTTADKIPIPEATQTRNMFKRAGKLGLVGGLIASTTGKTAETGQMPVDEEGFTNTEKLLAGTTAGAAVAARKPILRTLAKVARPFGFPSVAAGFAAGELLSDDPNLGIAGAELLAPELIKTVAPRGTGILSQIGRFAANPFFKGARAFTPVGLGLMGIEGIRMGMREQDRIDAMSPEEREDFIAEQESLLDFSA